MLENCEEITSCLKQGPEQQQVVGLLVNHLRQVGYDLEQIIFGRSEWQAPKNPSQASKREKGQKFLGFPCDIVVFDSSVNVGDYRYLKIIFECKAPNEDAGSNQLEILLALEPHAQLGIWANNPEPSAKCLFIYKTSSGLIRQYATISEIPQPGDELLPKVERVAYENLIEPSTDVLKKVIEDLLDHIVTNDSNVTRREDQLDQLCNLILLKLQSDLKGRVSPTEVLDFFPQSSPEETANKIKRDFQRLVNLYPGVFPSAQDKELRLTNASIHRCITELYRLRLIGISAETISTAFQVLRAAALRQKEGQYFTPQPVIQAAVKLMEIQWDDVIIDPACGTGGFLIECLQYMQSKHHNQLAEVSRWSQNHIFGIDKDSVGIKLTKAIMQILGDGSAHCARGDSVRTYLWNTDFPQLSSGNFANERFTVVLTNPPFGSNLKVPAADARKAGLDIACARNGNWEDTETGLIFLNRSWQLLMLGGRLCIVLPETYFFSFQYAFIQQWLKRKFRPLGVVNIPMEAFQGFCRAKTNLYIFERL